MIAVSSGLAGLHARLLESLRHGGEQQLRGAIDDLCAWLRTVDPRESADALCLERVRNAAIEAACRLEKHTAAGLLRCGDASGDYFRQVSRFTLLEAEAAAVNSQSKVLFVGAGALPTSACTLRGRFGCRVDCLDIDMEACRLARAVFDNSQLDLGVIWGRAERQLLTPYTHVWVASLVPEKEALLDSLQPRLQPGCRVLVRYANGVRQAFNHGLQMRSLRWSPDSLVTQAGHLHDTALFTAPAQP